MGWARPKKFRAGLDQARPSPAQARKIRAGLLALGPKIVICKFPNFVKIADEIRARKFDSRNDFFLYYIGPIELGRRWAGLFKFWPSPAGKSRPIPTPKQYLQDQIWNTSVMGQGFYTGTDSRRFVKKNLFSKLQRHIKRLTLYFKQSRNGFPIFSQNSYNSGFIHLYPSTATARV